MTMEGLFNTFCESFYPIIITDAASELQNIHVLKHLSLGKRISQLIVDVTENGRPHS